MKNLLYFISDIKYKNILQYNINRIKEISNANFDICCIAEKTLTFTQEEIQPDFIYYIDNFDYRYSAKYEIESWQHSINYDNFLYLDTDCIVKKNINQIFKVIENNKHIIHGVMEYNISLNTANIGFHRFSTKIYPHTPMCFNAGTFGFNKNILPLLTEFKEYITLNKKLAFIDQSLFNEFFAGEKNILQNTLCSYVNLFNSDSIYGDINGTTFKNAHIIHFLGGMYLGKNTIDIDNIFADIQKNY